MPDPDSRGIEDRVANCGCDSKDAAFADSLGPVGSGSAGVLADVAVKNLRQVAKARQSIVYQVGVGKNPVLIQQLFV